MFKLMFVNEMLIVVGSACPQAYTAASRRTGTEALARPRRRCGSAAGCCREQRPVLSLNLTARDFDLGEGFQRSGSYPKLTLNGVSTVST